MPPAACVVSVPNEYMNFWRVALRGANPTAFEIPWPFVQQCHVARNAQLTGQKVTVKVTWFQKVHANIVDLLYWFTVTIVLYNECQNWWTRTGLWPSCYVLWTTATTDSTGCFKKVATLKLFGIFSVQLGLFAWSFAHLLAVHIHIYLPIFCTVILIFHQMVLIFSTSTLRFHPVKFWVGLFTQKMKMQLFGNDVFFPHRVSQCPIIVNNR